MLKQEPVLSIVAVSRNDNHGGDMLGRMQHCVDGFIAQCNRHGLYAELIMVEWNPPTDRLPLAEALTWPENLGTAEVRIVTVPRELHSSLDHAAELPLFQMIGKNVGIRRARAPFILATNVDILFNDKLFIYMRDKLARGTVLRVDRFDVPPDVPRGVDFDEVIKYCDQSFYHIGTRLGMYNPKTGELLGIGQTLVGQFWAEYYRRRLNASAASKVKAPWRQSTTKWVRFCATLLTRKVYRIAARAKRAWPPKRRHFSVALSTPSRLISVCQCSIKWFHKKADTLKLSRMHTFACGDFTLMAREDWFRLRGYAEWPMYSWHIDSVFLHAARAVGIKEIALSPAYRIYHIEQTPGSGWSPQASEKLFSRLDAAGIPYLSNDQLKQLGLGFLKDRSSSIINDTDWGFGLHDLPETRIAPGGEHAL